MLSNIVFSSWHHVIIFLTSWVCFFIGGRLFFDNGVGQYHSSHLKNWVSICKALFLSTFVIACSLLELITFEILDFMHPTFRQLLWTACLSSLCLLLNVLIPGVLAATICVHLDLPDVLCSAISIASVLFFQLGSMFIKVFLPLSRRPDLASPSMSQLFSFDFQASVSLIAIVGTAIAAIIGGFATVSFPMEQLFVPDCVDAVAVKGREDFLKTVMTAISKKKSTLLNLVLRIRNDWDINSVSTPVSVVAGSAQAADALLQPHDFSPSPKHATKTPTRDVSFSSLVDFEQSTNSLQPVPVSSPSRQFDSPAETRSPSLSSHLPLSPQPLLGSHYPITPSSTAPSTTPMLATPLNKVPFSPFPWHQRNHLISKTKTISSSSSSSSSSLTPPLDHGQEDSASFHSKSIATPPVEGSSVVFRGLMGRHGPHGTDSPPSAQQSENPAPDNKIHHSLGYALALPHVHPQPKPSDASSLSSSPPPLPPSLALWYAIRPHALRLCRAVEVCVGWLGLAMQGVVDATFGPGARATAARTLRRLRADLIYSAGLLWQWCVVRRGRSGLVARRRPCRHDSRISCVEALCPNASNLNSHADQLHDDCSDCCGERVNLQATSACRAVSVWLMRAVDRVMETCMLGWQGSRALLMGLHCDGSDGVSNGEKVSSTTLSPGCAPFPVHSRPRDAESELARLRADIKMLEQLAEELFLELVCLQESRDRVLRSNSPWGQILRVSGYVLTLVGMVKLGTGTYRVCSFFIGGKFESMSQQADNVTSVLSFALVHLRLTLDVSVWSPIIGAAYMACMALLHVRGFIVSMQQFAKLGVLNTSTEIYSLVLAYMAGSYSVACVLFLRTQLPLWRRRGVTIALGEEMMLDFYFWLFDMIFILTSIVSAVCLTLDFRRKTRLNAVANNTLSSNHVFV